MNKTEPTDAEREELANLLPLGYAARDPYRNVWEAADAILAAGYRKIRAEGSPS